MRIQASHIWLFSLGTLLSVQVNVVGVLTLSEIVCFATFLCFGRRLVRFATGNPLFRTIALAWLGLLLMQVASDLLNDTRTDDIKRGWARTAFLAANTLVIAGLSRFEFRRLMAFFMGYAVSMFIAVWTGDNPYLSIWKFGYGGAVTMLAVMVIGLLPRRWADAGGALVLIPLGLLHFTLNARLLAGLSLLTGVICLFSGSLSRDGYTKPVSVKAFVALLLVAGFGIYQFYTYGVTSGLFGEDPRLKHLMQTADGRGVLAGGRSEYRFSLPAIAESPVIGHGSFARNTAFLNRYIDINGIDRNSYDAAMMLEWEVIPTHSHILGAWVESGIMGGAFWALLLAVAVAVFLKVLRHTAMPFRISCLYLLSLFSWDLLFSPFGLERRVIDAAMIVLLVGLTRAFRRYRWRPFTILGTGVAPRRGPWAPMPTISHP